MKGKYKENVCVDALCIGGVILMSDAYLPQLSSLDAGLTLEQAGLCPQETVFVEER